MEYIYEVVFGLLLTRTTTATSSMILLGVGALRGHTIVLLLYMRVESRVAEIALAAAANERPAHIIVLTASLVAHLLIVRRVSIDVIGVHVIIGTHVIIVL